jgi:glycosyltransferase involved in cell wall biosynthesis
MVKKPFISVLINNYNYGRFIAQCVESVLNQTYGNFELIIVDDGSKDDSVSVIDSFSDPRIIKIFKKNGGQASAFNAGFEASRGDIIAFLDSDDWWMPHKLETIVKWDRLLDGNHAFLQHMVDVWEDGKVSPLYPTLYSGNILNHYIEKREPVHFVGTSGLCFRREILNKVMPVPQQFRISADGFLTRTSIVFGNVISIPESLGYYRKHSNAVFGNTDHNRNSFRETILFPSLNEFYKKERIDYLFGEQMLPKSTEAVFFLSILRLMLKLRLDKITETYHRIAVFGAGRHTEWICDFLQEYKKENVTAVLDDNPDPVKRFWGIPAEKAEKWNTSNADAIILSSDCKQDFFAKRCKELYGDALPLIDLYDGLPQGPYPK